MDNLKQSEYQRKYYILNKERILESRKNKYNSNKEYYLNKSKKYYDTYVKGYKEGYYPIENHSSSISLNK